MEVCLTTLQKVVDPSIEVYFFHADGFIWNDVKIQSRFARKAAAVYHSQLGQMPNVSHAHILHKN